MSDTPKNPIAKQVQERSLHERRQRQFIQLKNWDAGKISGTQCIENIVNLEKIVFVGDMIKVIRKGAP